MKLHSNRIYTPKGPKAGVLTVEGGKITAFAENTTDPEAIEYGDQRIIPGIFDTHNHGTCGYDIMNKNAPHEKQIASVKGYLKGLTSQGTVNIFPTVCDPDSIRAVAEVAKEGDQDGATILGIHSEGPWLNRTGEKGIRTGWPEVSMETAHGGSRRRVAASCGTGTGDPRDGPHHRVFPLAGHHSGSRPQ